MESLPLTFRLLVLFLLLGINSFFSAAEVALVSVRRTRIRELAESGDRGARVALGLLESPDRMLSATQLGVTLASLGLGWAGESTVFKLLEPLLEAIMPAGAEDVGHLIAFGLSFTVITYFHMVIGEVVPKNLALERSERLAVAVAPPLEIFARVTGLFVSLVKETAEKLSRLLGLQMTSESQGYTAEELKLVVSVTKREDEHSQRQEQMIHRVIDFYEIAVREVMVPRQEMVALRIDATIDHVIDCIARKRHSRIPVYEGTVENVVGVVYAKELWSFIQQIRRWQMLDRPAPPFRLKSVLRDVEFVPETKMLSELLDDFQKTRSLLAMVVDEFGTVSGLVTIEDALEQIVGEIREEHEAPQRAHVLGELIELDGITNIRDLEMHYGIELPYDTGFETLAGFLLSRLGHIPEPGESVTHESYSYKVLEMERNRISRVRIEPVSS